MTRQYSDSIALAARRIVAASAVDITQPVSILPLAKQLMAETGCKIDAAKRHIAKAVRLARGELTTSPTWGGRRQPAGGRPRKMYVSFDSTMLDYYIEQHGLPFIAVNLDGDPIGFIFPQSGGYDTDGLQQVSSVAEMYKIAGR